MADYFDAPVVLNPNATSIATLFVSNALLDAYDVDDIGREHPLQVYEATSGAPITDLRSSVIAQLPQFTVEGDPEEVVLKQRGGTFETRVKSAYGMRGARGKSAFEHAQEFGFEGDEEAFGQALANVQSTVVGGHKDEEGRLVLDTAGGGVIFTGITQPADGVDGTDGTNGTNGEDGADGLIVEILAGDGVEVDNADPARPVIHATGAGGSGNGHVWVVQWNGTAWANPTPPEGSGAKIRIFDSMGATGVPAYTGPTIPGVTDYYAATFA